MFKIFLKHYWPHIKPYRWHMASIFTFSGIGLFLSNIASPFIIKEIIDTLSELPPEESSLQQTHYIIIIFALVSLFTYLSFRITQLFMSFAMTHISRNLTNYALKNLLEHSFTFFNENFSGGLISKSKRFVTSFESIFRQLVWGAWGLILQLTSLFIILFILSKVLFIGMTIWTVLFAFFSIHFSKKKASLDATSGEKDTAATSSFSDLVTNFLNTKMFSSSKYEMATFSQKTHKQQQARFAAQKFIQIIFTFQGLAFTLLETALLYYSMLLWSRGELTIGEVSMLQIYTWMIIGQLWHIGNEASELAENIAYSKEMIEIFEKEVDVKDPKNPITCTMHNGKIELDDITFSYDKKQNPVFKNFSLTIPAGQRVGLVGESGSGKSTLTKLLLRFKDVDHGAITIDGQDIREVKQDDLRNNISYVPQEPTLFHRSLRENIAYGNPKASEEEIVEASKLAHAHDFISKLPDGYDTLVGERGVKLSGGERQRVAIARAMLKNAPILILDEATSALDSVSEKYIQEALDTLMQGKTTLVIAHRLSTIQKMDRIIVFENGKIAEEGSHSELTQKGKGLYQTFWSQQTEGFI